MALESGYFLKERYRIEKRIAQGGMGAVYAAQDITLNVRQAVKENLLLTEASQRQFEREAQLLARLRHPGLPRVVDHFIVPGVGQYLVMDFIDGYDLAEHLEVKGPVAPVDARRWLLDALSALAYLHQRNIIHRDIKPANIKINAEGNVVLVDFGIAKEASVSGFTTTGARGLTPGFAPPEQYGAGQNRTDARSDVYALGATFYALLTGAPPADALARLENARRYISLRQKMPALEPDLALTLDRALALYPADRYNSALEMQAAFATHPRLTGGVVVTASAPAGISVHSATASGVKPPTAPPDAGRVDISVHPITAPGGKLDRAPQFPQSAIATKPPPKAVQKPYPAVAPPNKYASPSAAKPSPVDDIKWKPGCLVLGLMTVCMVGGLGLWLNIPGGIPTATATPAVTPIIRRVTLTAWFIPATFTPSVPPPTASPVIPSATLVPATATSFATQALPPQVRSTAFVWPSATPQPDWFTPEPPQVNIPPPPTSTLGPPTNTPEPPETPTPIDWWTPWPTYEPPTNTPDLWPTSIPETSIP